MTLSIFTRWINCICCKYLQLILTQFSIFTFYRSKYFSSKSILSTVFLMISLINIKLCNKNKKITKYFFPFGFSSTSCLLSQQKVFICRSGDKNLFEKKCENRKGGKYLLLWLKNGVLLQGSISLGSQVLLSMRKYLQLPLDRQEDLTLPLEVRWVPPNVILSRSRLFITGIYVKGPERKNKEGKRLSLPSGTCTRQSQEGEEEQLETSQFLRF